MSEYDKAAITTIIGEIEAEVWRARQKHKPMNSAHEGYSVILEELDELWTEVKADRGYSLDAMTEARQVAAMAVRYILDLSGRS